MMKLSALPQFKRDAARFKEIVSILAKYGLAHWIDEHEPEFIKNLFRNSTGESIAGLSPETRLRMALTELGPTFIKLGQILSTRADLIGPSYAAELTELQSDVPADPPSFVHATLESELGKSAADLFTFFDDVPVGSASIGQIHRATLPTGEAVVVKVQHEDIEEKIATDLDILLALAEMAEKYDEELRLYQPRATIGQFKRTLLRELDFRRERRSLEQFRRNFESDPTVHIPKPYPEISSRRVLTMEVLEGYSIAEIDRLHSDGIDTRKLAEKGATIFLNMIFRDSFYHADPHPGNIWVLPGGEIGLLDFGMVGRIDEQTREELEDMLLAALQSDAVRLMDYVIRIGSVPRGLDRQALRADISEFVADYADSSLKDFDLSGALNQMTQIIRDYRIILPSGISLLIKVLVMLEGTSRNLSRDFSLAELLKPYQANSVQQRYTPKKLLHRLMRNYRNWERLIDLLPQEMSDILQNASNGQLNVQLEHHRLDSVINRLVYGILTAALFLGSCWMMSGQIPPLIKGISVPGLAAFLASVVLGFPLLRNIAKSGGLGKR